MYIGVVGCPGVVFGAFYPIIMILQRINRTRKIAAGVLVLVLVIGVFFWLVARTDQAMLFSVVRSQLHGDDENVSRAELERHVNVLAVRIGERNMQVYPGLQAAAKYIEDEFRGMGYSPEEESYVVEGKTVRNIIVEKPGGTRSNEIILIGAHYDSLPGTTGADDNASGVAALLELAWVFVRYNNSRTFRLVAFVNEEPPYFQTGQMGSMVNAKLAKQRGDRIVAMLSLESIGAYYDAPGSQNYPPGLASLYPDRGNFIAFIANPSSKNLLSRTIAAYRNNAEVPADMLVAESSMVEAGWSDHWSFWEHGYPAVMVTDTAPFRYPHYHKSSDTPDKLDFDRMTSVVRALATAIRTLDREF
jgi:hypothetical protein